MARRRLTLPTPAHPSTVCDVRVQFVEVPKARRLMVVIAHEVHPDQLDDAIVWILPCPGDTPALLERARADFATHAAAVRVLPLPTEDASIPADAGTPSQLSDVSEVRPVVAELIAELPQELRDSVAAYVEDKLSEVGL